MEVTLVNRQRARRISVRGLRAYTRRVSQAAPATAADRVAVCLVSDGPMRTMNRRYRGIDATTDVLSFPGEGAPGPDGGWHLGDIVISVPQAARQARAARLSLRCEVETLILHGYIHLLGYDHEKDDGAMMRLQRRLIERLARKPAVNRR